MPTISRWAAREGGDLVVGSWVHALPSCGRGNTLATPAASRHPPPLPAPGLRRLADGPEAAAGIPVHTRQGKLGVTLGLLWQGAVAALAERGRDRAADGKALVPGMPSRQEVPSHHRLSSHNHHNLQLAPAQVKEVYLAHLLGQLEDLKCRSAIIFTGTCKGCHLLSVLLEELGIAAAALHSHKPQRARLAALDRFKSGAVSLQGCFPGPGLGGVIARAWWCLADSVEAW